MDRRMPEGARTARPAEARHHDRSLSDEGGEMKRISFCAIAMALGLAQAPDPAALFRTGKFAEADKACAEALAGQPANYDALLLRGRIALLSNRLADAERYLVKALEIRSDVR